MWDTFDHNSVLCIWLWGVDMIDVSSHVGVIDVMNGGMLSTSNGQVLWYTFDNDSVLGFWLWGRDSTYLSTQVFDINMGRSRTSKV
jgi:hypothetical protein